MNIFEIEKKILKAQSPEEIDNITSDLNNQQLRDTVKLLVNRINLFQQEQAMREFNERMKAQYRLKMGQ